MQALRYVLDGVRNLAEISIIIPVYNVENYLARCIESVLGQSFGDLEIIIVDDGSTDTSSAICDRYATEDKRVKVIHKKRNEGLVAARKTGIMAATSKFIGYVDGDDWIEPDMYDELYRIITGEDADIAVCSRYNDSIYGKVQIQQGIPEGVYDRNGIRERIFPRMIVGEGFFEWGLSPAVWDKLYRREFATVRQMKVDDSIMMGEDAALTYPLMLDIKRITITHRCLYHYRQVEDSMVRTSADTNPNAERERFRKLYSYVKHELDICGEEHDLSAQWLKYVLFLMTPRSDVLYRGLENLEYLFPYPEIRRGEKVLVYCAGLYGQRLYRYLKNTGFCECVALADKKADFLRKNGFEVISPDEISGVDYDAIAVAASYERARSSIIRDLRYRFPESRVYGIDYDVISSEKSLMALGLTE